MEWFAVRFWIGGKTYTWQVTARDAEEAQDKIIRFCEDNGIAHGEFISIKQQVTDKQ